MTGAGDHALSIRILPLPSITSPHAVFRVRGFLPSLNCSRERKKKYQLPFLLLLLFFLPVKETPH